MDGNAAKVKVPPDVPFYTHACDARSKSRAHAVIEIAVAEDFARIPFLGASDLARVQVGGPSQNQLRIQGTTGLESNSFQQSIFRADERLAVQNAWGTGIWGRCGNLRQATIDAGRGGNPGVASDASTRGQGGAASTVPVTVWELARIISHCSGRVKIARLRIDAPDTGPRIIHGVETPTVGVEVCVTTARPGTIEEQAAAVFDVGILIVVAGCGVGAAKIQDDGAHGEPENQVFSGFCTIDGERCTICIIDVASRGRDPLNQLEDILVSSFKAHVGEGEGGFHIVGESISSADKAVIGFIVSRKHLIGFTDEAALVPRVSVAIVCADLQPGVHASAAGNGDAVEVTCDARRETLSVVQSRATGGFIEVEELGAGALAIRVIAAAVVHGARGIEVAGRSIRTSEALSGQGDVRDTTADGVVVSGSATVSSTIFFGT